MNRLSFSIALRDSALTDWDEFATQLFDFRN